MMKKVDMKQWLENETKKVISDTKKYHRDTRYKKELDYEVLKKIFLMIPLLLIILSTHIDGELFTEWFGKKNVMQVQANEPSLFPNVWVCPNRTCGYSNYDGISTCALCGTARP